LWFPYEEVAMKAWFGWVAFTVLCWGLYVPVLHSGQLALKRSGLHAFLFVGVAYFAIAVLIPSSMILASRAWSPFSLRGAALAAFAGALGALGALGVIFALRGGGNPLVVAPVVFAGAPVVNTLASLLWHRPHASISPLFLLGCLLAACGAYLVLAFRPS
jgi:hypothetical protein